MGWVTERHKCTMDVAFENLRQAIKRDVGEANELLGCERNKIENGNHEGTWFLVTGAPIARGASTGTYKFKVYLSKSEIFIQRTGPSTLPDLSDLTISQRWDVESASCRLCLGGKEVSVNQICQLALESMFFKAA